MSDHEEIRRRVAAVNARRDHQIRVVTIAARIIYAASFICAAVAVAYHLTE